MKTIAQKIKHIREECYLDLNDWEKEFIDDLYEFVDEDEAEQNSGLSRRQVEKVEEIWSDLGL